MNKIFNIKASGPLATIFLYGDIGGGYDSGITDAEIIRELKEAESVYNSIDVRINSRGGDVYTGIAIFNALVQSQAAINIYVDGIAASMASVIALCGKPVRMSKYARLMIHSVSGGCYGTKQDLKDVYTLMESLEDTLCQMYSKKIGKKPEEIKALYFDGVDHYLTANEALSLGFIDGIYDAEAIPEDSNPDQIYMILNNRLNRLQNNNNMNFLEKIKKRKMFNSIASDDEAIVVIQQLEESADKVPGLEAKVTKLEGELKVYLDKAKADADAAKKKLLDEAVSEGRIKETQRAIYQSLLEKDYENGKAAIEALPKKNRVVDFIDKGEGDKGEGAWAIRQKQIKTQK
jgi:ATP-dependent protease ClpP protease subunit